jgi:hypothetical protein
MPQNPMMPPGGGPLARLSNRKIVSDVPIEIRIAYNEVTGQAYCEVARGGQRFDGLTALELVVIFSQIQVAYIQAGLGNTAGNSAGIPGADNGKAS